DRLDRGRDLRAHAGTDAVAADEDIGTLATPAGEMHDDAGAVLLHALEGMVEVVTRRIDGLAQEPLQPVPGGENLRQVFLCDHVAVAVESDAFLDLDAEVAGAGAALVKRVQQLRMGGDPGAAADQFDRRALIDVGVPPLLPQERRGKQAGHRATDNDGATPAPRRRGKRNRHLLDRTRHFRKMIHHPLAPARGRCGIIIPQRAASRGRGKVWWNGRADYAIAREDGRKRPWSHPPRGREQGRKTTCSCVYARASSRSCLPEAWGPKLRRKRRNSSTPARPSISSSATRPAAATTLSGGCSPAISAST